MAKLNQNDENVNKIQEIHTTLKDHIGTRVRMRADLGRSRIVDREGVLAGAHPTLFVINSNEKRGRQGRQCYQYVDILTGTVELFDPDTGESWFPECKRE